MKRIKILLGTAASAVLLSAAVAGLYSAWLAHKNDERAVVAEKATEELQIEAEQERKRQREAAEEQRQRDEENARQQLTTGAQIAALTELVRSLVEPGRPAVSEEAITALEGVASDPLQAQEDILAIAEAESAEQIEIRPPTEIIAGSSQNRVTYYQKQADGSRIREALDQGGISYLVGTSSLASHLETNSIACSASVSGDELQTLIRAMLDGGIQIDAVYQFRSATKPGFELLTLAEGPSQSEAFTWPYPPLSEDELFALDRCPEHLSNRPA